MTKTELKQLIEILEKDIQAIDLTKLSLKDKMYLLEQMEKRLAKENLFGLTTLTV